MAPARRGRPEGPAISADVVPLLVAPDGTVKVLLARRRFEPDLGELALPGVLILAGETVTDACYRALETKAGVAASTVTALRMAWLADSPVRDERGHTISVSYLAVVDDPAAADLDGNEAFEPSAVPSGLPFDHDVIITEVLGRAHDWLWNEKDPLARHVLGDSFTGTQASALTTCFDPTFNSRNGVRFLKSRPFLRRQDETKATERGRPPATWEFVDASARSRPTGRPSHPRASR